MNFSKLFVAFVDSIMPITIICCVYRLTIISRCVFFGAFIIFHYSFALRFISKTFRNSIKKTNSIHFAYFRKVRKFAYINKIPASVIMQSSVFVEHLIIKYRKNGVINSPCFFI